MTTAPPVDSADERLFMEGYCGYFALALHDLTGWEVVMELNGRDGNHVWCRNDQGRAVDIRGVHRTGYAVFPGSPRAGRRDVMECGISGLRQLCSETAILERAREIAKDFVKGT
jgi:hypothetical protein